MTEIVRTNPRADIYRNVTDTIVRDLEQGIRPWIKPWAASSNSPNVALRPLRHDGTPYRGVNVLILWATAAERGYASSTWLTYRQAQSLGAQVRQRERGTAIVYAKTIPRSEGDAATTEDTTRTIPLLRGYTVFNADQIEGLPARYCATPPSEPTAPGASSRIDQADAFVAATGANIQHKGNRACYIPSSDLIQMPPYGQFQDTPTSTAAEAYYATLLHELVHYTAPSRRCDRQLGKRFGDQVYAAEELIAEIGSAFLCAQLGVALEPRADHAAYIGSWIKILKSDKRAIFTAAAMAQRAVDWLNGVFTPPEEAG
jgi:antirestriction protein ArdC